ncbi:MAG: DUF3990 domain-containing protein [Cellulosilyticaceae bacterium]
MILYHGTNAEIVKPDVRFSKSYLDFGKGFYLTTYKEQAEKWAKRKALRVGGIPLVHRYELDDKILKQYKCLHFQEDDREWLEFISKCRSGEDRYKAYDIIIGSVADDDVFKTVDMYFKGIWEVERALKELRYYKLNDQVCIINQEILDKHLNQIEVYEVVE